MPPKPAKRKKPAPSPAHGGVTRSEFKPVHTPPAARPARTEPDDLADALPAKSSAPKSGVVIVGSLNMDLVVRTETMPAPGQTVMGQDLVQNPGGKGANQATAAGKLWSKKSTAGTASAVRMIGRVGDDLFGTDMITAMNAAKVDTASILRTKKTPSGVALIIIDRHGENSIVVAPGANGRLAATDLLAERKTIEASSVMAVQLETPYDTVACALALAKRSGVTTILDPAPAPTEGLPEALYHVDILSPNQSEAQLLTGIPVRNVDDARRAGERLLARGTRTVVFKMGSTGAVIVQKNARGEVVAQHIPGFRVQVVDTTAAGDSFTGALAVGLAEGMTLEVATRFANAAGALACTKLGAASAIPTRAEVELLLNPPPKPVVVPTEKKSAVVK